MIMQVHDELLFDVYPGEQAKLKKLVKTEMESVVKFKVPMLVKIHEGKNWVEASK